MLAPSSRCAPWYAAWVERRFDTVATYPTPVAAELAAIALREEGIEALVRDANTSAILPHMTAAMGYVKLDVPVEDAERARQLLREIEAVDGDELTDDRRCPECDSTYLKEKGERFECQRCGHRFAQDAAAEPHHGAGKRSYRGRAHRAPAGRDVFRLHQNKKGMGLFLGFFVGLAIAIAAGQHGAGLFALVLIMPALGWLLGRSWVFLVCSDPSCRARLRSTTLECPSCKGLIQGDIARAADHWVERAALRRRRDESSDV